MSWHFYKYFHRKQKLVENMALWGISDSDESKPKNLTAAEKKEVFANASGWVREAGSALSGNGNVNADPELLVAVSGLAVKLAAADITEIEFITTAFDKSDGGTLQVRVRFNEAVDVTGTPQLTVVNDTNANHTLSYASGDGTNELVFSLTIAAGNAATDADDVLSIGANAMALNGGTVKDAGTSTVSTITNSGAIGTAAGTITVVA
tara:strand:+ start:1462 stop:2082 length:621 start_codon:yes stop_codon:yes gene_type:complete